MITFLDQIPVVHNSCIRLPIKDVVKCRLVSKKFKELVDMNSLWLEIIQMYDAEDGWKDFAPAGLIPEGSARQYFPWAYSIAKSKYYISASVEDFHKILEEKCLFSVSAQRKNGSNSLSLPKPLPLMKRTFASFTQLRELSLSGKEFVKLPQSINSLDQLTYLQITNSKVSCINTNFSLLPFLNRVDLVGNCLSSIGSLVLATTIRHLDLEDNHKLSLDSSIGELKNLESLNLSFCHLASLPPEIGLLTGLTQLNLESNNLVEFPDEFYNFTNLLELSIGCNQLTKLSPLMSQMRRLTQLCESQNPLNDFPDLSSHPLFQKKIYFIRLKLKSIPSWIAKLHTLESLFIGLNELCDETLQLTGRPTKVSLTDNNYTKWPSILRYQTNLVKLWLDNNSLSRIGDEIEELINLNHLTICNNKLTYISSSITRLTNLQYIELSGNKLSEIIAPCQVTSLKYLILKENPLQAMSTDILKLPFLAKLTFSYNCTLTNVMLITSKLRNRKVKVKFR